MDDKLKEKERKLTLLEAEGELISKEAEIEEKKALIKEAKRRYGRDWKKILFGVMRNLKPNQETIQTLYSLGLDSLRDVHDPRAWR